MDDKDSELEPQDTNQNQPTPDDEGLSRRRFLSQSALAGAAALALKNDAYAQTSFRMEAQASTPFQGPTRARPQNFGALVARERVYAEPADVIVGLSEEALNGFLAAHFDNNPDFYDRGRSKGVPIYRLDLNDHGITRTLKFFAKITKPASTPAVYIDLRQTPAAETRFTAWWRATHGANSIGADTKLPPNIVIRVGSAILQVDFPKLDGSGNYHQVDFHCSITTAAFMLLKDDADKKVLQLIDWDIVVAGIDDPLDPNDPIWGPGNPACTAELMRLRLMIRDAFTLGTNVALTELSKTLTRTMPLPPLDIVKGIKVIPRELFITEQTIAMSASLEQKALSSELARRYEFEMLRFEDDLKESGVDLDEVFMKAPRSRNPEDLETYLISEVPAYKKLNDRHVLLKKKTEPTNERPQIAGPLPTSNVFVMLSSNVFDVLAKTYLTADKGDCSEWRRGDIGLLYAQGRACYWFKLSGASGALSGTTVSGGCDVKAGGGLELQACIRIPCAPDQCATYKPGFGLRGPLKIRLTLENLSWNDNKALRLKARADSIPGFEIYGLPPVVGDLANWLVNWVSSVALKIFINALLLMIDFVIVQIPLEIPEAHVKVKIDNFGASNIDGMLTVTGRTRFS